MSNQTTLDQPAPAVPRDTFAVRLAIIRTEMGWNYDQAAAATGINSENWRVWEKGKRRCTDIPGVARKLSEATGYSRLWIMDGGPLLVDLVTRRNDRPKGSQEPAG